jgi:GT2 family glycosyltransferase
MTRPSETGNDQTAAPSPDFTVILATRNRAAQLARILPRLGAQATGGAFAYDVLVVDNGSTDETRRLVDGCRGIFPVPLHCVYEGQAGKSNALNTGMAEALGRIFAFTDDDTRPASNWLQALWTCFCEEPAVAVTGKVPPQWIVPPPAWLTEEAFRGIGALGCVDHGARRLRSTDGQDCRWVGGNLAIRREAAERVGPFDVRLERGQDTDYYRRAVAAGLAVVYEPAAIVYHEIPPERLTKDYFRHWYHRAGRYRAELLPWKRQHLVTIMPRERYRRMASSARGWLGCRPRGGPWWQQFRYELMLREDLSTWFRRLQLWPRWWLTVLTGRSFMP